jgi:hypothetical protein
VPRYGWRSGWVGAEKDLKTKTWRSASLATNMVAAVVTN